MPRSYLMTWEPGPRRWRKVYKGKTYTVSCRDLKVPQTKDISYQAANAWWTAKRAEIDRSPSPPPVRHHDWAISKLEKRLEWCLANGEQHLAGGIRAAIALLIQDGKLPPEDSLHESLGVGFLGEQDEWLMWEDRLRRAAQPQVPEDQMVGGQVADWLATLQDRVKLDLLSADRLYNVRDMIERFAGFVGPKRPVSEINEDVYERYFYDLARSYPSKVTAHGHLRLVKQFVRYLFGKRLLELPRNLRDPALRFKLPPRAIVTYTADQVRALVRAAKGQPKLHVLLGLNCGFGPTDISEFKQSEVDWEEGTITRKRSKTDSQESVPVVRYKLWQSTFALLRQFNSGGDPVLRTRAGGEWAFRRLREDGTLRR